MKYEDAEVQPAALSVRSVRKEFPGAIALENVSLDVQPGEVHCLLGENGAGKSTLIRILAGVHPPDEGEVLIDGERIAFRSPADAFARGVVTIYQVPAVVGTLTVQENILLGEEPRRLGIYDPRVGRAAAGEILKSLDRSLPLDLEAKHLRATDQQVVTIARALRREIGVFVLDEPTATLGADDAERLFDVIRKLTSRGSAVLFVTHRLREALMLGDTFTVLRDGRKVLSAARGEIVLEDLVAAVAGKASESTRTPEGGGKTRSDASLVLNVVLHEGRTKSVESRLELRLEKGEILGLIGLVGSGKEEVVRALGGDTTALRVEGTLNDRPIRRLTPSRARNLGIAYLPGDRRRGIFANQTALSNVSLPNLESAGWALWVSRRLEERLWRFAERLRVRPSDPRRAANTFSGGNQQRLLVARALAGNAQILVLEEPTVGVDVGARADFHDLLVSLAAQGTSAIIATSDVDEALAVSDRLLVFDNGQIVAEIPRSVATEDHLYELMSGSG